MSELSINTPILTADYADSINADIQRKIDGKLFLFCNYSPDVYPVFTEKEVFEVSLNDLYNLFWSPNRKYRKYSYVHLQVQLENLHYILSVQKHCFQFS